jgi:hypothetical protein
VTPSPDGKSSETGEAHEANTANWSVPPHWADALEEDQDDSSAHSGGGRKG